MRREEKCFLSVWETFGCGLQDMTHKELQKEISAVCSGVEVSQPPLSEGGKHGQI